MDLSKLKRKLKGSGIELIINDDSLHFKPIKVSVFRYLSLAILFIPGIYGFLYAPFRLHLRLFILAAGISCLYNGVKSAIEASRFNSFVFKIEGDTALLENGIPLHNVKKFKANLATNLFFPNSIVKLQTKSGEELKAFGIWNKNKKYLNEDKYEIVNYLNEYLAK